MNYPLYTMLAAIAITGLTGGAAYAAGEKEKGAAAPYTQMEPAAGDPTRDVMISRREVETMQRNLMNRGYATGPIDGIIGPRTKGALLNFQRDNNLSATGTATNETLMELGMRVKPKMMPEQHMQKDMKHMQDMKDMPEMQHKQDMQMRMDKEMEKRNPQSTY